MNIRILFMLLLVICATPVVAAARERVELSRPEIRSLPIHGRPSRPGHFYGNAVRRSASRTGR